MINAQVLSSQFNGLSQLPALRQLGLLVGLAAAVAIGVGAVLWAQTPSYRVLYPDMALESQGRAIDALRTAGIEHRLATGSGDLMVPAADAARARLALASEGLPESGNAASAMLEGQEGFGTSRRMESARLQQLLERELAQSITTLRDVDTARIHLALPERSAFLRDRKAPSASVVLDLHAGRTLGRERIGGVRHLVAASVPGLDVGDVAVLDHKGALLSPSSDEGGNSLSGQNLVMTRELERTLVQRIEHILAPLVGSDGLRAQVSAEVDYTERETTSETYEPGAEGGLVRSEQVVENAGGGGGGGAVPGALANSPPAAGTIGEDEGAAAEAEPASAVSEGSMRRDITRNYELNRRVEHEQTVPGQLERLSVAVVVDEAQMQTAAAGAGADAAEGAAEPRTQAELDRIEALVREAVGFDAARGDSIRISSAAFVDAPASDLPPAAPEPFWQQPQLWDGLRQFLGVLVVIVLLVSVLRPVMKNLANPGTGRLSFPPQENAGGLPGTVQSQPAPATEQPVPEATPDPTETQLTQARSMAEQDPQRVAQLTRAWIGNNG